MLLTTPVTKQREAPATVCSFYVSVLYTAMLRTSIAAVVLGCLFFCPSDWDASVIVVDCAAVEAGFMLKNTYLLKVATKYVLSFIFWSRCCCCCCCVLLLLRAAAVACCCCPQHQYSSGERYYFFFFGGCAPAALHSSRGMC